MFTLAFPIRAVFPDFELGKSVDTCILLCNIEKHIGLYEELLEAYGMQLILHRMLFILLYPRES